MSDVALFRAEALAARFQRQGSSITIATRATLRSTDAATRNLHVVERQRLLQQRDDLVAQIATLTDEIQVQQATIRLDRRIVSRKLGLQAEGIMPIDVLEVAQRQLAGDESSLLAQRLSLQKLRQSLYDTEAQLHELPLKQATELDDLARQLAAAEGDLPLLRDGRLYCGSGDRHFYVADLNSCELEDVVKIHVGARRALLGTESCLGAQAVWCVR